MTAPETTTKTVESGAWVAPGEAQSSGKPRLVVAISAVSDPAALARRILALSPDTTTPVLLAGVTSTWDREYELRRSLVTVESFLGAQGRHVELWSDSGHGWLERLAAQCGRTDLISCYEELDTTPWKQPLSDVLAGALRLPVRDLTDLARHSHSRPRIVPQAAAWLGSIALIAGFGLLQAQIVTDVPGWAQAVLLLLTAAAEIGLIVRWNALLG